MATNSVGYDWLDSGPGGGTNSTQPMTEGEEWSQRKIKTVLPEGRLEAENVAVFLTTFLVFHLLTDQPGHLHGTVLIKM